MAKGRIAVGIILALFIVFSVLIGIYGDLFWFISLGLEGVYLKILLTSVGLGFAFALTFLVFSFLNYYVARRISTEKHKHPKSGKPAILLILFFALIIGSLFSEWQTVLMFLEQTPFGTADPVFGMDIGFYVFSLPFYQLLFGFMLATVLLSIVTTLFAYLYSSASIKKGVSFIFEEESERPAFPAFSLGWDSLKKKAISHLSVLVGLLFLLIAGGFLLARYSILFSKSGVVFGAGYADVAVDLPLFTLLAVVSALVGLLFFANAKLGGWKLPMKGIAALVLIAALGFLVSGVVQALVVAPNEFNLEKPYIERNIQATLQAYKLDRVQEKAFPLSYNLTKEDIERNSGTINNIRIWDWRPLQQTFNQMQLFRTYYEFNDVDIDRYMVDGEYKQVMVSAREMNTEGLQAKAQTWVNKVLVYTHGYGTVMIPVDRASEGLPEFFIKDIPPQSDYGFVVGRPEIYFGEGSLPYVIVGSTTEELDYPSGDQNIFTTYSGTAGVMLSDTFRKLVYAFKFRSPEIFLSGSITPESRVLLNRRINERVGKIAPFLRYDRDPYIVLADGKLYWIVDAYTITGMYPYSESIPVYWQEINYVRNSVKVVVDAYNGDVRFYVMEKEPIIETYRKIFPELFLDFSEMPEGLKAHIRYPEDLFTIQSAIYSTYHMKDPQVFYNREDVWVTPDEMYRGGRRPMTPYYVIMKLPGEEKEEFIMIIPFTPKDKQNMIAWMAAKSDMPDYGELVVFQFSKQMLAFGPMQIEARIDQNTEISQKLTLWGQSGSSVIRGNTLVIPIEDSIIYIEPLYLEAQEKGTLPELKRVILAYGNKLTMKESLKEAIEDVFGEVTAPVSPKKPSEKIPEEILTEIASLYNKAQTALKEGDLAKYAEYMDSIGELL